MIPADFRSLLLSLPGMFAMVGPRVFPVIIPAEQWDKVSRKPCLVYTVDSVRRQVKFCGTDRLKRESVSVDAYARNYDDAYDLAKILTASVEDGGIVDFRGTIGNTYFEQVTLDTELELIDPEPGLYRRAMTFSVWNRSA